MELRAALGTAQLISMIVFITAARWYLVPWLKTVERSTALTVLLWLHVFRYVALQAYSAQRAGFPISDEGLRRIVAGDVGGMILALFTIVALRHRLRLAIPMTWLLVITTLVDTVSNISGGICENLFGVATGITWMVVAFYVPLLMVSVVLTVWQLYSRRAESFAAALVVVPQRSARAAEA